MWLQAASRRYQRLVVKTLPIIWKRGEPILRLVMIQHQEIVEIFYQSSISFCYEALKPRNRQEYAAVVK